jgi:hypothetical protein
MSILESLFSKSIISEDKSSPVKIVPQVAVNPSVAELVKKHMDQLGPAHIEVPMVIQPAAATDSGAVMQKPIETIVEEVPSTLPEIKSQENILADVEKIERAFVNRDLLGRNFVDVFLREISDLVLAGQLLNEVGEKRTGEKLKGEGGISSLKLLQAKGQELYADIQSTLATIASDDSGEAPAILAESVKKYGEYLETFENALGEVQGGQIKKDNILLLQIQKRKSEINGLLKLVGGPVVFDAIKSIIQKAEGAIKKLYFAELRKKFPEDSGDTTSEKLENWSKHMFSETTAKLFNSIKTGVAKDLPGFKMLTQGGDVISVLQALVRQNVEDIRAM